MNIAAIMESTSEAMRVQISQTTQRLLDPSCFCTEYRGEITVPRLGNISTYWLTNKKLEVKKKYYYISTNGHFKMEFPTCRHVTSM